jgi:pimeloyl-ACP methyl ester carboxylesterase
MTGKRNMLRSAVAVCLSSCAILTSSACAHDDPSQSAAVRLKADFTDSGPGSLISATALPTVDFRLRAATSLAARITYRSTSGVDDSNQEVTGTVFSPKGKPPDGGWPVVAFGHPPTGIQPECAPSLSPTLLDSSVIVTALVQAGYVVTVPDYQGLGVDQTYHPYLDSTTVGYNLIDSVRAVRKIVPDASNRWVALGVSQGGQATWAANELMDNYGYETGLLGSVSISPPSDLSGLADAAAADQLTRDQQQALQAFLATLKKAYNDFPLDDFRRGVARDKWDVLSACQGAAMKQRPNVVDQIGPDDLRPISPDALATLHGFLEKTSLPQAPAQAPMLVIYGGQDSLIPPAWTERALGKACNMGDVVQIQMLPDKGNEDIDVSSAFDWIGARFGGLPAQDDCGSFLDQHG